MTPKPAPSRKNFFDRFLHFVEVGGNALPHPASIFVLLAILVLILSWFGHLFDWTVLHPATNERVHMVNLLSKEGVHRIFLDMVDNYTGFAPLGIVMVALLGIGIAESSGLVGAVGVNTTSVSLLRAFRPRSARLSAIASSKETVGFLNGIGDLTVDDREDFGGESV